MIFSIFAVIFILSGILALRSLSDLKSPKAGKVKIAKKRKGLAGVIYPPSGSSSA